MHRGVVTSGERPWADLFPEATAEQWSDWRWQQRNALRTLEALEARMTLTEAEREGVRRTAGIFRLAITPYYFRLVDRDHPFCPVRMQVIPTAAEAQLADGDLHDPLGEDTHRPVTSIVHKYPDRVLLLALDSCSIYCRHCTRRRITKGGEETFDLRALAEGVAYVRAHREVRDVLISGGDPLLLSDARLDALLGELAAIPHVEMIRIGTRVPVVLPMRITDDLARTLRRHAPVYVVTHFNHPKEVTPEAAAACERLVDHGVPVENQSVLLRRVNSEARVLKDLNHRLLRHRVRPYYLHQGDLAEGTEHLRTPLSCGVEILEQLRGHTTGLAVPHLAVDLPGGAGKVTLQPDYVVAREPGATVFRSFRGERVRYPEPAETDCTCPYSDVFYR